jgi:hypothetical protein
LTAYCSSKAFHEEYAKPLPSQNTGIYGNFRGTRNGNGSSGMACPVTIHEVHQGVKQDKMVYHNENDEKFNEWNENVAAVTQTGHTHNSFHECDVPEDVGEKSVCQKLQFL